MPRRETADHTQESLVAIVTDLREIADRIEESAGEMRERGIDRIPLDHDAGQAQGRIDLHDFAADAESVLRKLATGKKLRRRPNGV